MSQKVFRKSRAKYDEICLEFVLSDDKEQFFGKSLNYASTMIKEINTKCNKFIEFQYFLRYRKYTLYSMYIILPFMFLLSVIGLTTEAFGLAWFFIAFLFVFILCFFVILYLISAKMNRQFLIYSQLAQEILDQFNIKYFLKDGIFSSFRTRTISDLISSASSRPDLLKIRGNYSTKISFKFFVQSKLIRILRTYFWIEFIRLNSIKKFEFASPMKSRLSEIHIKYSPNLANIKESEESERSAFTPPKIKVVIESPLKIGSNVKTPKKKGKESPIEERIGSELGQSSPQVGSPSGKDKGVIKLKNIKETMKEENSGERLMKEDFEEKARKNSKGLDIDERIDKLPDRQRVMIKEEERLSPGSKTETYEEKRRTEEDKERRWTESQYDKGSPDVYRFESVGGPEEEQANDFAMENDQEKENK